MNWSCWRRDKKIYIRVRWQWQIDSEWIKLKNTVKKNLVECVGVTFVELAPEGDHNIFFFLIFFYSFIHIFSLTLREKKKKFNQSEKFRACPITLWLWLSPVVMRTISHWHSGRSFNFFFSSKWRCPSFFIFYFHVKKNIKKQKKYEYVNQCFWFNWDNFFFLYIKPTHA